VTVVVAVDISIVRTLAEAATVVLIKTLNKRKLEEPEVALREATREAVSASAVAEWEARLPNGAPRIGGTE
jgi:hypothetical protein